MQPRLSFVLAVHGEQAYIEECVRSVFAQPFADVELVAIDDASPDHAPALLDALAERDARITVEHLPDRAGPGAARNLGLELARGEYVWFIETTDYLAPGSLAVVVERLDETGADVLVTGHARADELGRERPGPHRRALSSAATRGPAPIERDTVLAETAIQVWDKLFRRELLASIGARFGDGRHGELSVTWPALLAAAGIAALPDAVYIRRRPANATPPVGSPLDAFDHYDAIFERADVTPERAELLVSAMVAHGLDLLDRVAGARRRELFMRLAESYRRHGTARPGLGPHALYHGRYAELRALEAARAGRRKLLRGPRALRRRASAGKAHANRSRLMRHYRSQLRRPIDPDLAVFAAYWYRGYYCNPRAIYEKARELVPAMRGVWVVNEDAVASLPAGVEHVVAGTSQYYEAIARARYFVNNVNFPGNLVKRDGSVHVMTHHGTPLKRMGLDQRGTPVSGQRINFAALMRRCARWDFSISSNAFSTVVWERAYPLRYETLEVGYPRNDVLATATDADIRRIRAELGIDAGQTAVLYAPTHREWQQHHQWPLDLAAVAEGLGPDHVLLARVHYFHESDPLVRELHRAGRIRDVSRHPSVEQLCLAADVLLTDYSSIMFDYAVLDRRIVIHAPDWEVYSTLRGVTFDLIAEPPGVVTTTTAGLVEALRSGADDSEARRAFRARFCLLDYGRASERVVRRVWFGERVPATRPVPAVVQ